jgi:hypothetical protein
MALKSGLDNKRIVTILAVLGVVVIAAGYYAFDQFFGGAPAPVTAPAQTASAPSSGREGHSASGTTGEGNAVKISTNLSALDPTLHPELMAAAESLEYSGSGRNIFSMNSAPVIEQVKGPVRPIQQQLVAQAGPPAPPPPPPIQLKFFGFEAAGSNRKAFLLHGDDVFIAAEGDVVDHHYRIIKINPLSIQVTDLLYNNTQTLPLAQS